MQTSLNLTCNAILNFTVLFNRWKWKCALCIDLFIFIYIVHITSQRLYRVYISLFDTFLNAINNTLQLVFQNVFHFWNSVNTIQMVSAFYIVYITQFFVVYMSRSLCFLIFCCILHLVYTSKDNNRETRKKSNMLVYTNLF